MKKSRLTQSLRQREIARLLDDAQQADRFASVTKSALVRRYYERIAAEARERIALLQVGVQ